MCSSACSACTTRSRATTRPTTVFDSYKLGTELTYAALPWLAVSGRFDRLVPDTSNAGRSFAIVSPKLIFRTNWQTREAITLQYAKWIYGSSPFYEGDRIGLMNNPGQKLDDRNGRNLRVDVVVARMSAASSTREGGFA